MLSFVSNYSEEYTRCLGKGGMLAMASMPIEKDVVAMTQVSCDDGNSPNLQQLK